jgi:phytoene/squalene synthetase
MLRQQSVRLLSTSSLRLGQKSQEYCINLVQQRAHEQYLTTLLLPSRIRRCGFAIRAFNAEIAGIRDQITAKIAGVGRMVFWRETIEKLYSSDHTADIRHPVATELKLAVQKVHHF